MIKKILFDEKINVKTKVSHTEELWAEDVNEIKEVLSSKDHDGYDVLSNTYTYASVIYVLAESPKFIIAPGKPHETEYVEIKFNDKVH